MSLPATAAPRPVVLVGVAVLAITMLAFFRVPLLPSIGRELSMSTAELGMITTVFAVGRLVTDIPAGRLADARSAGWMLGGAAGLLAMASLVLAAAPGAAIVFVAAFLLGVSSAATNTTGSVHFAQSVPEAMRGRSMAAFSAALLGGQALGPAVGGLVAAFGTWRTAQAVAGVLAAIVAAVILVVSGPRFRSGLPSHSGSRAGSGSPSAARPVPDSAVCPGDAGASARAPAGLRPRERAILYAVPFTMFFTLGALPQTLVPVIGAENFGLDAATIGLALGLGGLCRFAGAAIGGVVSDRVSRKAALVPGLLGQAGGVALLALPGVLWAWVCAIVVMSLASFGISVANTVLGDRVPDGNVGRHFGAFRFVGDVGLIAGPAVVAGIFQRFGQQPAVLLVAGLLAATAAAAAFGLPETLARRAVAASAHPAGRPAAGAGAARHRDPDA